MDSDHPDGGERHDARGAFPIFNTSNPAVRFALGYPVERARITLSIP
jgi:hypothetical protein